MQLFMSIYEKEASSRLYDLLSGQKMRVKIRKKYRLCDSRVGFTAKKSFFGDPLEDNRHVHTIVYPFEKKQFRSAVRSL